MPLKKWSLSLSLTAGSTRLSLRIAAETLIPPAVDSLRLSACHKPPRSAPLPPPNRPRNKKLLSKIGFLRSLRKIRLLRRGAILPATPPPTDNEDDDGDERMRSPISSRSRNARKAAASLWAVVVAWILWERLRGWCGDRGLPGQ